MTTEALENVIFWLEKRKRTFTTDAVAGFMREPRNKDTIQAAQDVYALLLSEAKGEHKLAIEYGGYLNDSPPVMIFNTPD